VKDQIPFALSRTVNTVGWMIQRDTIDRLLPSKFTLRTDWWKPGRKTGVNLFKSNKSQWPDIAAKVNTIAPFMEQQESGGVRTARAPYEYLGIPTKNAQPDRRKVIPASNRLLYLMGMATHRKKLKGGNSKRNRVIEIEGSVWATMRSGKPAVYIRAGKDRLPIRAMYYGVKSKTIKPRFGFYKNGERIINENFERVFNAEFLNALATAK
jgi:hypothetical protein